MRSNSILRRLKLKNTITQTYTVAVIVVSDAVSVHLYI